MMVKCPHCGGQGLIRCDMCYGSGRLFGMDCPFCKGRGGFQCLHCTEGKSFLTPSQEQQEGPSISRS